MLMVLNVLWNVVLNVALIPMFGAVGAATATALALLLALVNLQVFTRWRLGFALR